MKGFLKAKIALFFIIEATLQLNAQKLQVDYYGVVSSSQDTNMLKMAQDLFFTQLNSIDGLSVSDKRPDLAKILTSPPEITLNQPSKIVFYAEINSQKTETQNINWHCDFYAKTSDKAKILKESRFYDSYYKMLTGAKESLEELFSPLKNNINFPEKNDIPLTKTENSADEPFSVESLSGTWSGEPFSDKIVILRGGRGFIILKNGATMNILVKAKSRSEITITQTGKPNASFYPSLPRDIALQVAQTANPIEWNFSMASKDTLSGTKNTIIESAQSQKAEPGIENITWTKK
ncbi:TP0183 family DNA metabolism protein [Treponema pectinovorum]|uniref:TP0183 family DNA metabolism protein n=1 Tax=Treponema pectinovorum TaxID=164 RepID=UPI0011CB8C07|nr:hypothetical protein [Treponema pectinovorum]